MAKWSDKKGIFINDETAACGGAGVHSAHVSFAKRQACEFEEEGPFPARLVLAQLRLAQQLFLSVLVHRLSNVSALADARSKHKLYIRFWFLI